MTWGTPPRRNVAMFIDLENLFGGYGRDVTTVPLGKMVAAIGAALRTSGLGSGLAVARAYANWGHPDMGAYRREVQAGGIEPVQVFAFESVVKNAADIELCVDALAVAHDSPWVEVFVLVTGDGGFVPLVRRLHALGKHVVVVSGSHANAGFPNRFLAGVADAYYVVGSNGTVQPSAVPGKAAPQPDTQTPVQQHVAPQPAQAAKAPPQKAPAAPRPATQAPPKKTIKKTAPAKAAAVRADAAPTLEDYKAAVRKIVKGHPGILVDGKIQGSPLGAQLRQRWPDASYKDFGSPSLGSFLKTHLGLELVQT